MCRAKNKKLEVFLQPSAALECSVNWGCELVGTFPGICIGSRRSLCQPASHSVVDIKATAELKKAPQRDMLVQKFSTARRAHGFHQENADRKSVV